VQRKRWPGSVSIRRQDERLSALGVHRRLFKGSVLKSLADFQQLIPNTALEPLGVEVLSVDENGLTLRMPITNATRQPFGLLHGGISLLLAESAASMHSAWDINPKEVIPVGIEVNGSHLRSATAGYVLAVARLLRRSKALAVHSVEIVHEETKNQLCTCRVTNYYKRLGG
jgi:1,4-dihydroxy-2-naphthoyl-CoA hydrolase